MVKEVEDSSPDQAHQKPSQWIKHIENHLLWFKHIETPSPWRKQTLPQ